MSARFGSTYTKIGTIQRRLAWPLRKDDPQIREAFHIFQKKKKNLWRIKASSRALDKNIDNKPGKKKKECFK